MIYIKYKYLNDNMELMFKFFNKVNFMEEYPKIEQRINEMNKQVTEKRIFI